MSSELSTSPNNLSLIPSSPLESYSPTASSSTTMQSDTSEKGLLGSGAPTTAADQKHCSANPQAEGKINVDNHSTQTEFVGFWVPTFTPETCLELLPSLTPEQLYRESLSAGLCKSTNKTLRKPYMTAKLNLDSRYFDHLVRNPTDKQTKHDNLTSDFCMLLEKAEQTLDEYKEVIRSSSSLVARNSTPNTTSDPSTFVTCPPAGHEEVLEATPVRSLRSEFEFETYDVCDGLDFQRIGSRDVSYFGSSKYSYGSITHRAKAYPPSDHAVNKILDCIAEELDDPTFNRDNVTCMVTRYQTGSDSIPFHSDNETGLTGEIITASFGATRTLTFRNIVTDKRREHELRNGTVYAMTTESQFFWEHAIHPESDVTSCRVSVTFRRIDKPMRTHIPKIHEPSIAPSDPLRPSKQTVLYLTDSMIRNTPSSFPSNFRVIKRDMYQLTDLMKFENFFENCDYVIISSGINDLSRYDHRSYTLSREIRDNFKYLFARYPKTVFVFNSLLRTRFAWLNKEVDLFNRCMFDFSLENHNFWFFDSHHICSVIFNNGFEILDSSGNGIHITQLPKSEIANCLVTGVQKLSMRSEKVRKHWPLRREFVSLLRGN